jgi:hypothetical protein
MASTAINFLRERRARIEHEISRLRLEIRRVEAAHRLQIVDASDCDSAVCMMQSQISALERELDEQCGQQGHKA